MKKMKEEKKFVVLCRMWVEWVGRVEMKVYLLIRSWKREKEKEGTKQNKTRVGIATEQCVSAGRKERMDQDQLGLHCICTDNCILYFGMEFILILYSAFNNCFTILAK
jgi:hypothetical protein